MRKQSYGKECRILAYLDIDQRQYLRSIAPNLNTFVDSSRYLYATLIHIMNNS